MVCLSVSLLTPNSPPDQNPWSSDPQPVVSVEPEVGSSARVYFVYSGQPPSPLFFWSIPDPLTSPGATTDHVQTNPAQPCPGNRAAPTFRIRWKNSGDFRTATMQSYGRPHRGGHPFSTVLRSLLTPPLIQSPTCSTSLIILATGTKL